MFKVWWLASGQYCRECSIWHLNESSAQNCSGIHNNMSPTRGTEAQRVTGTMGNSFNRDVMSSLAAGCQTLNIDEILMRKLTSTYKVTKSYLAIPYTSTRIDGWFADCSLIGFVPILDHRLNLHFFPPAIFCKCFMDINRPLLLIINSMYMWI